MAHAKNFDVIVLGAGAAGMMCAIEAGRRGKSVVIIDHAKAPGEKIRISGGGKCNFTNVHCTAKNFLSENPSFAISVLKAYTPQHFIEWVRKSHILFHEKTLGQLFCNGSATEIIWMITSAMAEAGVTLLLNTKIEFVTHNENGFSVETSGGVFDAKGLVVATGGKSIPKMGATGLGYDLAKQFGHRITDTRPALVPFTWPANMIETWSELSGLSLPVRAVCGAGKFDEALLMTHRGMSGPAMLQVSSYWREGDAVEIDLAPGRDMAAFLKAERNARGKSAPATILAELFPKRLAQKLTETFAADALRLADMGNAALETLVHGIKKFAFLPGGTEGYRTAEVTLGGVATDGLNQKTMESKTVAGLYFIGEVVDVTGHLGGHNFQWAWSSGAAAGRSV
jgi:predicted Rossmann fold flavoprotein